MSKPRKLPPNSRATGTRSSDQRSSASDGDAPTSKQRRLPRLVFAAFIAVVAIGLAFWLRKQLSEPAESTAAKTQNASEIHRNARTRSLAGSSAEQLEALLKIPSGKDFLPPSKQIDVQQWTQQLEVDLSELLQKLPNCAPAEHLCGLSYLKLKRTKLAEPHLRRATELEPENAQMRQDLADLYLQLGQDAAALDQLQSVGSTPVSVKFLILLSESFTRLGKLTEANQTIERARELAPESAEVWLRLSKTQQQLQQHDAAEQSVRRALQIENDNAESWLLLSQLLTIAKKKQEAADALQRWKQLHIPRQHYAEDRDFDFESTQSMSKFFVSVYRSLSTIYEEQNDLGSAINSCDRSLQVNSKDADSLEQKASCLRKLGQFEESAKVLRQAIALRPQNYLNYQNLANLAMEQRMPMEAEAALRLASLKMPENGIAQLTLARFLMLLNKPTEAIEAAQAAVRLLRNPEASEVLSQALSAAGLPQ